MEIGRARGRARQQVRDKAAAEEKRSKVDPVLVQAAETAIAETIRNTVARWVKDYATTQFAAEELKAKQLRDVLEDEASTATMKAVSKFTRDEKSQVSKILARYEADVRQAVQEALKDPSLIDAIISS